MPATSDVAAPAKLNLGLRIVGVRDDGYHRLESLFVPLDLADRLHFDFGGPPGVRLELARVPTLPVDAPLPEGEDNLVVRAARCFYRAAQLEARLSIRLDKAVPVGAGLGGGSSDAGAVLRTLAAVHEGALAPARLLELAADLGADVPFFLRPEASAVRGIGERIAPIARFPGLVLVLANPGQSLATAQVFADFDRSDAALTLASSRPTMRALEGPEARENAAEWLARACDSGLLANDLEPAATRLCPAIARLKQRLGEVGARWTGMSGSGATVYGIFEDQDHAESALERAGFRAPVWSCVTRVMETSGRVERAGRIEAELPDQRV